MRAELKKFLFVGNREKMEPFFDEALDWGVIHFSGKPEGQCPYSSRIQKSLAALKMLPPSEAEEAIQEGTVERLLHLKERLLALESESAQHSIAPFFGEFSFDDLKDIEAAAGVQGRFYWAPTGHIAEEKGLMLVNREGKKDFFLSLTKEPLSLPKLHEVPAEMLQRCKELPEELRLLKEEIRALSAQRNSLAAQIAAQINISAKSAAERKSVNALDNHLFGAFGWVPEKEIPALQGKVEALGLHMLPVAADSEETPPTLLENTSLGKMGEDLVNIYDTPSATDKDPSLWVIAFFALFFAFIIGDGGYGLLFLGAALFVRWKYALGESALRAWRIVATVSAACVAWGLLTTSFFGIPIAEDSVLRKFSALQWAVEKKAAYLEVAVNPRFADHIMLELALLIGVIHLSISLLRYAGRNPPAIGWLIFLWSATLYLPSYLKVDSMQQFIFHLPLSMLPWALYGMGFGMALATVLSLIKNKWLGLLEPTTLIQLFGDSMSYLRLYALALAGSMMTGAILELSSTTNVFAGTCILILGHLANIVLSIMGGTIHGLRLNFLEWYHYSFEGGGKPYQPLRRIS